MPALMSGIAHAQQAGVTIQGNTGGLVIPSALVLPEGGMALSYGNFQEPQTGRNATHQNLSLGFGLFSWLELYGRFANYVDSVPGTFLAAGISDLSANIKLQLPTPWVNGPKIAFGVNDVAGGATHFDSRYVVASDQYGPLSLSLGFAKGVASPGSATGLPTFDGAFGGVAWRFGETGLSALAEHDGQQRHVGLRWQSPPVAALAGGQLTATVQQSSGGSALLGAKTDPNFALALQVPLGAKETRAAEFKSDTIPSLPALDAKPEANTMQATAEDRLASLSKALIAAGLERVRVGQRDGASGPVLMVEYENHRYAHNEADALGLVLGLAVEMAPAGTQRVSALTVKDGLGLYETSVGVAVYREFLREGAAGPVQESLAWSRQPDADVSQTRWIDSTPGANSRLRIELKPDLNYTLGTEFGPFDYSLAANVQARLPLWSGARLNGSYLQQLDNSPNMAAGGVFEESRQRSGLKTLTLQQNFWLGRHVLASVSAGRFHFDTLGVQGEAMFFIPGTEHLLRARGASYNQAPGGTVGNDRVFSASYRHMLAPAMSLEAGYQAYGDGSQGPSLEWSRWFGDVSVGIFYRRGGDRQFAGLQMSIPLTPRQGMAPGTLFFSGPGHYAQAIRTRITTASQPANLVQASAVRDLSLESSLDLEQLNAGRASQSYFAGQMQRMREVFYTYARGLL